MAVGRLSKGEKIEGGFAQSHQEVKQFKINTRRDIDMDIPRILTKCTKQIQELQGQGQQLPFPFLFFFLKKNNYIITTLT